MTKIRITKQQQQKNILVLLRESVPGKFDLLLSEINGCRWVRFWLIYLIESTHIVGQPSIRQSSKNVESSTAIIQFNQIEFGYFYFHYIEQFYNFDCALNFEILAHINLDYSSIWPILIAILVPFSFYCQFCYSPGMDSLYTKQFSIAQHPMNTADWGRTISLDSSY